MVFIWILVGVLLTTIVWAAADSIEKLQIERDYWKKEAELLKEELREYKSPLYAARKAKERRDNKCL